MSVDSTAAACTRLMPAGPSCSIRSAIAALRKPSPGCWPGLPVAGGERTADLADEERVAAGPRHNVLHRCGIDDEPAYPGQLPPYSFGVQPVHLDGWW